MSICRGSSALDRDGWERARALWMAAVRSVVSSEAVRGATISGCTYHTRAGPGEDSGLKGDLEATL